MPVKVRRALKRLSRYCGPLIAALLPPLANAQGAGAEREQQLAQLGQRIFFDTRLSEPPGVGCVSCHEPARAFSGDNGSGRAVARGSRPDALGKRNAPSLMYLGTASSFGWREKDGARVPFGGFFWDGRAASLQAQAREPFFNPVEMNNPDAPSLIAKIAAADYAATMRALWGEGIFADPAVALSAVTKALAAYQHSDALQPFTSKFDAAVRGQATLNEQESRGQSLFLIRQKGNCASCHTFDPDAKDPRRSLFTDFGYHALGAPRNNAIAARGEYDLGLCGPTRRDLADASRWCGFFKTPTLRNVALTAPYMHNGRFATLREAVAFYATRDTEPESWYADAVKFDDLPAPLRANVDVETPPYHRERGRRPALRDDEIDDLVAFLRTLTDGYRP